MPPELQHVLVVEDDPDIQAIVRLALESIGGFTVAVASNGREALEIAPAFGPDLVLLDVMMPELDGPSTLQHLRRRPETAETPVVFLTAKAQQHETEHYRTLGIADIIPKPFDPVVPPVQVRTIWEYCHAP
ncbi:MAG: response regulator, partial [Rhodothermales bacterium]|nr:response regulator [Rhodothermales bacterium]